MLPDAPERVTWTAWVVIRPDGRFLHTRDIGIRGTVQATLHPDGRVVTASGPRATVDPDYPWDSWAYLVVWIDPATGTARFDIVGEPTPTGRLDHLPLVVMRQGGNDYGSAKRNLVAHMRLDPRYAPVLRALRGSLV